MVFKKQFSPQKEPLWSCMPLCYGGKRGAAPGGPMRHCSSCLLLQPAGQHSFAINHQNLGSDVKQTE